MSHLSRRWLAAGAAVLAIGGGSGLALAQGGTSAPSSPAISAPTAPDSPEPGDTPDRPGAVDANERDNGLAPGASSVQAPNTPDANEATETPGKENESESVSEAADDKAEKAESAALASLAKVDQAQAERAALAKVPGTVSAAQLGNENGNVVWEIDVKGQDGVQHEVKVDAGNGTVLMAGVDDQG